MLAEIVGMKNARPLRSAAEVATGCKLAVFVPVDAADKVAEALFAAGRPGRSAGTPSARSALTARGRS